MAHVAYFYVEVPPEPELRLEQVLTGLGEVAGAAWYAPAHQISAQEVRLVSDAPNYELIEEWIGETVPHSRIAKVQSYFWTSTKQPKRQHIVSILPMMVKPVLICCEQKGSL